MNYESWHPIRWTTILSNIEWLFMDSLLDNKSNLTITFSDDQDNKFRVVFNNFPAYRNISEEYRLRLWGIRDKKWKNLGNTWVVNESDWLKELIENEPLISLHENQLIHFLICTQDDVIEILSSDVSPRVEAI